MRAIQAFVRLICNAWNTTDLISLSTTTVYRLSAVSAAFQLLPGLPVSFLPNALKIFFWDSVLVFYPLCESFFLVQYLLYMQDFYDIVHRPTETDTYTICHLVSTLCFGRGYVIRTFQFSTVSCDLPDFKYLAHILFVVLCLKTFSAVPRRPVDWYLRTFRISEDTVYL